MKHRNFMYISLVCLTALPTPSAAGWYTGRDLSVFCKEDSRAVVHAMIDGALGAHDLFAHDVCVPRGLLLKQAGDVVCSYIYRHQEQHKFGAGGLIMVALVEAWPCSTEQWTQEEQRRRKEPTALPRSRQ